MPAVDRVERGNLFSRIEPTAEGEPIFLCAHLDTVLPEGSIEPVIDEEESCATRPARSWSGQQGRRRSHARGDAPCRGRRQAACGHRAALHAEGGGRLAGRGRLRRLGVACEGRVRLRPGRADRRRHPRCAVCPFDAGALPRSRRALACTRRKGAGHRARGQGDFDLRLGRLDEETTANVGLIEGGTAGNIVPEWCTFLAEARSHDERKLADVIQEMLDAITFAAPASANARSRRGGRRATRVSLSSRRSRGPDRLRRAPGLRL